MAYTGGGGGTSINLGQVCAAQGLKSWPDLRTYLKLTLYLRPKPEK